MFSRSLKFISEDGNQKTDTRYEAITILKHLSKLETVFLADFWAFILDRFNQVSKSLQQETLEFDSAIKLLKSLLYFVMSQQDQFEKKAKDKVESPEYSEEQQQKHLRRRKINDSNVEDVALQGSQKFKVETYLSKTNIFSFFLVEFPKMNDATAAAKLQKMYLCDIESQLVPECFHFGNFIGQFDEFGN